MASNNIPYFRFFPADFMLGVRGMSAQEIGVYTMILCRIYESSGPVEYNPLRLATYCGMRQATFDKVLEKLVDLDKLQMIGGMISQRRAEIEISKRAHDMKSNSKAGKASAEKRQQNQSKPATDVQQPFNHTDTDTDTDRIGLGKPNPVPPDNSQACFDHFNTVAAKVGWPVVQKISASRRAALSKRLHDVGGEEGWRAAIDRAALSPLLTGQNGRGWSADFDWLCKPANFTKLMEGNYDPRPANASQATTRRAGDGSATVNAFATVAARYRTEPQ